MPEREPHVPAELPFDLLDRVERLPRVRALVIAVLDDQAAGGRTPDVIDFLIRRRQAQRAVVRHRVESHRVISWRQAGSGWLGGSRSGLLGGRATWGGPGSS